MQDQDKEIILDVEDLRKAVDDMNIYFTQKIKDLSDKTVNWMNFSIKIKYSLRNVHKSLLLILIQG